MEPVTATRSELLLRRAQIALAMQGRDVLKEKRDQLMEEFRKIADMVLAEAGVLDETAAEGRRILALAEADSGREAVLSAALATRTEIPIEARAASIMGVRIARIEYEPVGRGRADRGYSMAGSTVLIDRVAEQFETELDLLLQTAARELRLRRIADEIGKTTRRVNALETVVLPRLAAEKAAIQAALDERERQDRFRLKRFATRREQRAEEQP